MPQLKSLNKFNINIFWLYLAIVILVFWIITGCIVYLVPKNVADDTYTVVNIQLPERGEVYYSVPIDHDAD